MLIFTARQNLANLNEVKMNLIVKFANLAGKSYIICLLISHELHNKAYLSSNEQKYVTLWLYSLLQICGCNN